MLYPFEAKGYVFVYEYDEDAGRSVKYEYQILRSDWDVFTCDFQDGSRILMAQDYQEVALYEYGGEKSISADFTISEILWEDRFGEVLDRYIFSEGYPQKTILRNEDEIIW